MMLVSPLLYLHYETLTNGSSLLCSAGITREVDTWGWQVNYGQGTVTQATYCEKPA